ncbi:MAG: pyridoxal-phosphate dependent enzyme [Anaerolineae bacterium]
MPDEVEKMTRGGWERFPRVAFAGLPTALEPMPRLSAALGGPRLWVKRDDLTDLGGGNKVRPLEYLMADALDRDARAVVTFAGGPQSNHLRATASAARKLGLEPILVVFADPPADSRQGNLLLNRVLGARMVYLGWAGKPDPTRTIEGAIQQMRLLARVYPGLAGRGHYVIPVGSFAPLGAMGYAAAAAELTAQADTAGITLDYVVVAAGTGTTAAGLVAGFRYIRRPTRVIAVDVGRLWHNFAPSILRLAVRTSDLLGRPAAFGSSDLETHEGYVGVGYSVPSREGQEAIHLVARTEGLMLEPVYTAKAMAALLGLVRSGRFGSEDNVVFIHTGGAPALYAYADQF